MAVSNGFRLPHPNLLLGGAIIVAAALTWILPAGQYERRDDPATGRRVVVAGTYHRTDPAPVGPFGAAVAVPRGFIAAAEVIGVVLFVGGAWVVVDRLGTLRVVIAAIVRAFAGRGLWVIPIVSIFFAAMGALENMEEEIIALVPALMVLGAGVGIDGLAVVAMSIGAAMVGAAFGPTNPFQAGIALRLAQLPPLSAAGLRLAMFGVAVAIWIVWTLRYAVKRRREVGHVAPIDMKAAGEAQGIGRHALVMAVVLAPMAAYVYGALRFDWGLNELSGAFIIGGLAAGLIGGMKIGTAVGAYVDGMRALLPQGLMVGLARSISIVLDDGRIVDTILYGLVTPLTHLPAMVGALLMIPVHGLIHIVVPSVSGQAVLTMPLFVPMADVLGLSRQVPVLAYQTGAGLMQMMAPTNGSIMAILLAAGVSYDRWMRFLLPAVVLLVAVGVVGILVAR
jgi:uncharacterized ion transporter superfamily protein YfcC